MNKRKIGILIDDFKIYHSLLSLLKERKLSFESLDFNEKTYSDIAVLITNKRDLKFENVIQINKNIKKGIREALPYLYEKKKFKKIVIGIDPGPNPALCVIGDNEILETHILKIKEIQKNINEIYTDFLPEKFLIRIGNGDITNRNRIINQLIDKFQVEIVNEEKTTFPLTKAKRDVESAKHIAKMRGVSIKNKFLVEPTEGEIKNTQRKSRIASSGKITIGKKLAEEVTVGTMTMKEAINIQSNEEGL